jgi:hypothetical protein
VLELFLDEYSLIKGRDMSLRLSALADQSVGSMIMAPEVVKMMWNQLKFGRSLWLKLLCHPSVAVSNFFLSQEVSPNSLCFSVIKKYFLCMDYATLSIMEQPITSNALD